MLHLLLLGIMTIKSTEWDVIALNIEIELVQSLLTEICKITRASNLGLRESRGDKSYDVFLSNL